MAVHIFQIGCKDIGKLGFEKFLEFEKYFPTEVKFEGIHCRDFDAESRAENFSKSLESEITFFDSVDELYSAAQDVEGEVLVYDAGPPHLHSHNIGESLRQGFHHLTEKPPSVTREEHVSERKLASKSSVNYKVDFVERENPVVQKIEEIFSDEKVEDIKVFRESSFGVQRVLQPVEFSHVKGGCVLDKMSNDIYIMELLESGLEFEGAEIDYLMPKNLGGEKVLMTNGSGSRDIDGETAIGKCVGRFSSGDASVELSASWLGLSDQTRTWNKRIREKFDESIIQSEHREIEDKGFQSDECRFIVVEGEREILADLLHQRIYDLKEEEELGVPSSPRDQLYRVLEKAVLNAAGIQNESIDEEEVDEFMNALFDVQESSDGNLFEEVDSATERIRSLMTSDKKILDEADNQGVAR